MNETVQYSSSPSGLTGTKSYREEVLQDYYICCSSREASILARREVLTGKAKFGITGDGKEVAQVAMAKAFRRGDYRSGYYRDQTLMFALGFSLEDYFSQLYADTEHDPYSKGRQMMSHFATPMVDPGGWTNHLEQYNSAADVSCTAGQVAKALGLAMASDKYRKLSVDNADFSFEGNEVVFCTIGDGSTSEGAFWESINAAAVMQIPVAFCVWDDGYSISVPKRYQTVKASISSALEGFAGDVGEGIKIYHAKGWNYVQLCQIFIQAIKEMRSTHQPILIHVDEMTQPQGHSTSGSHERYKPADRLAWEKERDCIGAFAKWIVATGLATRTKLDEIEEKAKKKARKAQRDAWSKVRKQVKPKQARLEEHLKELREAGVDVSLQQEQLSRLIAPATSELITLGRRAYQRCLLTSPELGQSLRSWIDQSIDLLEDRIQSDLHAEGSQSALNVPIVRPTYEEAGPVLNGFEILNRYFDHAFHSYEHLLAFGEDVGVLGSVNQGFKGLQAKYGEARIFDTGIREWTIVGQAIGLAMRGFRPIAEIQYLDYILYALAPLSDDLASLSYRSGGIQKAPVIIRTRGHRLEGIWHAGSPMSALLGSIRGMYICVPRNMVQAAGMYATALQALDPVLIIECLNGYRLKEQLPSNLGTYTVPFGVPEVLREGTDLSLITYGSCVHPALEAARQLAVFDIELEVIDIQTLLPFDLEHHCASSLAKTNKVLFVDEDVSGGASAYMMQQVLEKQDAFGYLEIKPRTLTGTDHRPPYGTDGDFCSKPDAEDIFEIVLSMMHEVSPDLYPLYQRNFT